MMDKVVVHFCIVVGLCMVAGCNGEDESKPKAAAPPPPEAVVYAKKWEYQPEVTQMCKNTAYPDLCSFIMATDPSAKNADLTKRIIIFIRTTTVNAIGFIDLMKDMVKLNNVEGDEVVMNCVKNCTGCYYDVVVTFDDSLVELVNKNYGAMKEKIQKADVYEAACQNCFAATQLKDDISPNNEFLAKLGKITISFVDALQKSPN